MWSRLSATSLRPRLVVWEELRWDLGHWQQELASMICLLNMQVDYKVHLITLKFEIPAGRIRSVYVPFIIELA